LSAVACRQAAHGDALAELANRRCFASGSP
jgi:hypothetical protein